MACPKCQQVLRIVGPHDDAGTEDFPFTLAIHDGPDRQGEQILLGPALSRLSIGNHPKRNIVLRSPSISRAHCDLVLKPTGWQIHDQGSTNGTFVNGEPVEVATLTPGDRIRLGDYLLLYLPTQRAAAKPLRPAANPDWQPPEESPPPPEPSSADVGNSDQTWAGQIICPTCDRLLPAGRRLCGECGTDAALARAS
ncbi:MAG: FHA domain-containing protein [Phycisphaeraceae bacterium]|nr:FHA domain-containing protein [Phycisphaeraceae bacterium]